MDIPLEISYKDVPRDDNIDTLVREKAARLDRFHEQLNSCRIAIELDHRSDREDDSAKAYRVRINMTVPPKKELVVTEKSDMVRDRVGLEAVIRKAFSVAERQLRDMKEIQSGEVKEHPHQQAHGIIKEIFPGEGYGFIQSTDDGREIYFHRNSVIEDDFDELEVGNGVRFMVQTGEKGPQASTVKVINR